MWPTPLITGVATFSFGHPTISSQGPKSQRPENINDHTVFNVQTAFYGICMDFDQTHRLDRHNTICNCQPKVWRHAPLRRGVVMILQVCEQIFCCNISIALFVYVAIFHLWLFA